MEVGAKIDSVKELAYGQAQYHVLKKELNGEERFPKSFDKHMQKLKTSGSSWWCSGFYHLPITRPKLVVMVVSSFSTLWVVFPVAVRLISLFLMQIITM